MKIAIVGAGFVGRAVGRVFEGEQVEYIDPKLGSSIQDLVLSEPEFVFVCIPTPSSEDGSANLDGIKSALHFLVHNTYSTIIVKSTVTPSFASAYARSERIVFNPEFLTERNAYQDMVESPTIILGGHRSSCKRLELLYRHHSACTPKQYVYVSHEEAAWIKHATNAFLAVKVTFLNELRDNFADAQSWNRVVNALRLDPRLGSSHWLVPGLDGKRGFGGACLPKDATALLHDAQNLGILNSAIKRNNEYRALYEPNARETEQNIKFGETN